MRLTDHTFIIPPEKVTGYLLKWRAKSDKSQFLAQAGFTLENPESLLQAIQKLVSENDAIHDLTNEFGEYYIVEGDLIGKNGISLGVMTIWIVKPPEQDIYRFVTLKPSRR
ncbi:MAG: hypothetical protein SFZ02_20765 [bacterium]|nr:hypothetical protein [bacterium]